MRLVHAHFTFEDSRRMKDRLAYCKTLESQLSSYVTGSQQVTLKNEEKPSVHLVECTDDADDPRMLAFRDVIHLPDPQRRTARALVGVDFYRTQRCEGGWFKQCGREKKTGR